jgi:hypothetical protein
MFPLLEISIGRGFRANFSVGTPCGVLCPHGHEKNAFALVRAGADICQTALTSLALEAVDEGMWTALVACRVIYGNQNPSIRTCRLCGYRSTSKWGDKSCGDRTAYFSGRFSSGAFF